MLKNILPERFQSAISNFELNNEYIEEIRIRLAKQAYLVTSSGNYLLNLIATQVEMDKIMQIITGGSLYAHRDSINKGFITLDNGIRAGIAGRAGTEQGEIVGVFDVSEISFRIPNNFRVDTSELMKLINNGECKGLLIYSPPGVGKTTLLKSLAYDISYGRNARRCCVIDTRCELTDALRDKRLLISTLINYPRRDGIEIAVRNMNPQVIICDEIGDEEEANSILKSQSAGVILIASAHGRTIGDLLSREVMERLHKARIFDYYVGLERDGNFSFKYHVTPWERVYGS